MLNCKILADSISENNIRLTTLEVTFPRIVLAEFNTHRVFSRNSASSRAIPVQKMIDMVNTNPYIPWHWGQNQKGMSAEQEVSDGCKESAINEWLMARDFAVQQTQALLNIGIHKQITNRLLEPFMWHTVIVTATEWNNFFDLRIHTTAHPDIRRIAEMMKNEMDKNVPTLLKVGDWHLPLIFEDDNHGIEVLKKVSAGRCARVSYLTHDGKRNIDADIQLHDMLKFHKHMSPFEHVATPMNNNSFYANFKGWQQYRWELEGKV